MPARPLVSIVLPARNEAAGIVRAVLAVDAVLGSLEIPYEIIVGDSASADGTGQQALGLNLERVRVVRVNRPGKGRILGAAMATARGSVIGFLDSDLEIDPEYLRPAIAAVIAGADAAIGSKVGDPAMAPARSRFRRTITTLANVVIRAALGTSLSDHQAGMKVFRREALLGVLPRVRAAGWLWDTELLAMLCVTGARVREISIHTQAQRPSRFGSIVQLTSAGLELTQVCIRVRGRRLLAKALHRQPGAALVPVK